MDDSAAAAAAAKPKLSLLFSELAADSNNTTTTSNFSSFNISTNDNDEDESSKIVNSEIDRESSSSSDGFFSRLKSYRRWWSCKPAEVSPWWCSRYGWYCAEKDLLRCDDCRCYLSAHLPSPADDIILHRKSTTRLRGLLIHAHSSTCLWRSNLTSERVCAPNVDQSPPVAWERFSQRLRSLAPVFEQMRSGGMECQILFNFDENQQIPEFTTAGIGFDGDGVSKEEIAIALLGWRKDDACPKAVCCDFCLRRVGLWQFSAESGKQLDPIRQHHKWCPWISSTSASLDTRSLTFTPAWLALLRLLQQHHNEKKKNQNTNSADEKSFESGELGEHFVLARQLIQDTIPTDVFLDQETAGGDDNEDVV